MAQDETIRKCIESDYREHVKRKDIPNELREALKVDERLPVFFVNLATELSKVPRLKRSQIKDATESLADIFIGAVKARAEQRTMSTLEVLMHNHTYQEKRKFELMIDNEIRAEREAERMKLSRR